MCAAAKRCQGVDENISQMKSAQWEKENLMLRYSLGTWNGMAIIIQPQAATYQKCGRVEERDMHERSCFERATRT
jgi:hypothetical protein